MAVVKRKLWVAVMLLVVDALCAVCVNSAQGVVKSVVQAGSLPDIAEHTLLLSVIAR